MSGTRRTVDLNADLGEGAPWDEALMALVTTANVACGAHAGSPDLARATAARARDLGLRVAAHPGYPDRPFGRQCRAALDGLPSDWLASQLALFPFAAIKPHGGLYHDLAAGRHRELLPLFAPYPLIGLPGHVGIGAHLIPEGFAERGYRSDGSLVPRGEPGALIADPQATARQALALAPRVETICVHGDSPGCVEIARAVRVALEEAGWTVGPVEA